MTRRVVNVTLDNLDDLVPRCRACVFWELDPVAQQRSVEAGDTRFEKESWLSATLLEWGSCGKVVYVDGVPAGHVLYAPPAYVPRSVAFPTSPVSPDAVLLMTGHVLPALAAQPPRVSVVGVGADGWDGLPPHARRRVEAAEVLVGSQRQLDLVPVDPDGPAREPADPVGEPPYGLVPDRDPRRVRPAVPG